MKDTSTAHITEARTSILAAMQRLPEPKGEQLRRLAVALEELEAVERTLRRGGCVRVRMTGY